MYKPIQFIFLLFFTVYYLPFSTAQKNHVKIRLANLPAIYDSIAIGTEKPESVFLKERILDLVQVSVSDSILKKKREHHKFVGGFFLPLFGLNWRLAEYKKRKWIGTVYSQSIYSPKIFREHDVNFNIAPHLPHYLDFSYHAYLRQDSLRKLEDRERVKRPPFVPSTDSVNTNPYRFHCECTPPRKYLKALDSLFYPTFVENQTKVHQNFDTKTPSIGVYGAYINDCNHTCHPEIHPYEWIWWREHEAGKTQIWHIGLMHDDSKRIRHWTSKPKIGVIRLPFAVSYKKKLGLNVDIEHGVISALSKTGLKKMSIPAEAIGSKKYNQWELFLANLPTASNFSISVSENKELDGNAYKYWIENIIVDKEKQLLTGYFCIAVAAKNVYTGKISIVPISE